MIKLILNGSFRSGTTLMWRMMRDGNPDCTVFTEPLHNDLFRAIHNEQTHKENSHGYPVMAEYVKQGEGFLKLLRRLHPCMGRDVYSLEIDDVIRYIKIFDSLDRPVILQPNRMHFILSEVAAAFGCKVVHIIRQPLDVFLSTMFSSPKLHHIRKILGVNPYRLRAVRGSNPYYLDEQCDFVSRYFGVQDDKPYLLKKWICTKEYYLERFILVWTMANWYAVHETDIAGGITERYEDVITKGEKLMELSAFSGVAFDDSKIQIHNKSVQKYREGDKDLCVLFADRAGVGDKFRYLIERFCYE